MRRHLAILLRAPELGRGKRRLARDIGDLAALRFQRAQVVRLRRLLRDPRWSSTLWVTPDRAALRLQAWPQGRGDLGARMARPFRRLPPGPVVLIGAKGLTDEVVAEIDRALKAHELIKVRVPGLERAERDQALLEICQKTGAHAVQQVGKVLVLFRKNDE